MVFKKQRKIILDDYQVLDPTWKPYGYLNATGLLAVNLPEDLAQSNFLNLPLNDRRILAASGLSKI